MLNFHAIQIIGKQRQLELEQEAKMYRLIKESKKRRKEELQSKKQYSFVNTAKNIRLNTRLITWLNIKFNTILNTIGKFLESMGRALQKKSQTC